MSEHPKIYVWCNSCSDGWHVFMGMAEDGTFLASHVCSSHGFAPHDMGIDENGWKRDVYAKHYPQGFTVELVADAKAHPGLMSAYALNQAARAAKESSDAV